jgi:orotate phosphoribosyltransferase
MPTSNAYKIQTKRKNLFLRVVKGHFATSHSHINYYIDVTTQKSRLSEAKALAEELVGYYRSTTIVDTILCLDGTEVIGTCLANQLTEGGFSNLNAHQTIYIVTPEHTSGSQIIFRDSVAPMITGKNVLILAASVTTGYTAQAAIEAIRYYNGFVAGVAAIFATRDNCAGYPVQSVFNPQDLGDFISAPSHECPLCKAGKPIDALVNSFGYSKL